jgi:anti-anti-sigma regulatory factor
VTQLRFSVIAPRPRRPERTPAVVRVAIELAGSTVDDLGARLELMILAGQRRIVLDLEGAERLDISAQMMFLRTAQTLRRLGGELQLWRPGHELREQSCQLEIFARLRTVDAK